MTFLRNPFLAIPDRRKAIGFAHAVILIVLEAKYGPVSEELDQRVRRITDLDDLGLLYLNIALIDSLPAFLDLLDLATTSSGD